MGRGEVVETIKFPGGVYEINLQKMFESQFTP